MWAKLWLPSDSQVPVVVIQSKKLVAKVATVADTDTDLVTMQSLIQKKMGIWKMVMNVEEDIEQGSDSESNYSDTEDVENSADRIQFYEIGYAERSNRRARVTGKVFTHLCAKGVVS